MTAPSAPPPPQAYGFHAVGTRSATTGALATLILSVIAFLALAADLHFHGQLFRWGDPLRLYFHEHNTPRGVLLFSALSFLGEVAFIAPYALIAGIFLYLQRQRTAILLLAAALIGSVILNESLKHLFQVPRPDALTFYAFPPHPGYSFPSGHTMGVTITAGITVMLASRLGYLTRRETLMAALAAALLSLAVAFALMYMGVHTLLDVLGALPVSTAWLAVVYLLIHRYLPPVRHMPAQK